MLILSGVVAKISKGNNQSSVSSFVNKFPPTIFRIGDTRRHTDKSSPTEKSREHRSIPDDWPGIKKVAISRLAA